MVENLVFLSLGSNQGNRLETLQHAINQIKEQAGTPLAVSKLYETEALGFETPEKFLNCCIKLVTELDPSELLTRIHSIEKSLGRQRSGNIGYESRTIDIDIVFFNEEIINNPELSVPHPRFRARKFVLVPLNDLDSDFIDPETLTPINQLLENCEDNSILLTIPTSLLI